MGDYCTEAYAKINIGLDVTGRRDDGYHSVRMVMQTVGLSDTLEFTRTGDDRITVESNVNLGLPEDNLIYKAIDLIRREYGIRDGINVRLTKRIPLSAGLAGGSSDCAASLRAMNSMFRLDIDEETLARYGLSLGADVPYCLLGGTALAEGIGEILTPLPPLPPAGHVKVLLVKPNIGISTKAVYHAFDSVKDPVHPDIDGLVAAIKKNDFAGTCSLLGNILETVSCSMSPAIDDIKESMLELGAVGSLMSGSGPTVFGLFTDSEKARAAYRDFKRSKYSSGTFFTGFTS